MSLGTWGLWQDQASSGRGKQRTVGSRSADGRVWGAVSACPQTLDFTLEVMVMGAGGTESPQAGDVPSDLQPH